MVFWQDEEDFPLKLAKSCIDHYNAKLSKTGKPAQSKEWTVLSAVVMTSQDANSCEIVSMGSGSKCLSASQLCKKGTYKFSQTSSKAGIVLTCESFSGYVINDGHAEIMARRGFLRYLQNCYSRLKFLIS